MGKFAAADKASYSYVVNLIQSFDVSVIKRKHAPNIDDIFAKSQPIIDAL